MHIDIITAVIQTLDRVEVRGKPNLDMLLGCINALERLAKELEKEETKEVAHGG